MAGAGDSVYVDPCAKKLFAKFGGERKKRADHDTEIYLIGENECYNFSHDENSASGFFNNVYFDECTFLGLGLKLKNCTFVNVEFKDCTFDDVWFTDMYLRDVKVVSVQFEGARWSEDSRQSFSIDEHSLHTILSKLDRQRKVGRKGLPDEVTDLVWLAGQVSLLDGTQVDAYGKLAREIAEDEEEQARKLREDRRSEEVKLEANERERARRPHQSLSAADIDWLRAAKPTNPKAFSTKSERRMGKAVGSKKCAAPVQNTSSGITKPSAPATPTDLTAPSNLESSLDLDKKYPAMVPSKSGNTPRSLAIEEAKANEQAATNGNILIAAPASRGTPIASLPKGTGGKERQGLRIPSGAPSMFHAESKAISGFGDELDDDDDSSDTEHGDDLLVQVG